MATRIYKNKKEVAAAKRGKGHDKSGTKGKRPCYYTIHCEIHGTRRPGGLEPVVVVGAVWGRKAKVTGCPKCQKGVK